MRIDKFLKLTQLIKRRSVANEAADEGFIFVNGISAKPSKEIKSGDIITIDMWNYTKKIEVLEIPISGSINKNKLDNYIKIIEYIAKDN